MDQLQHYVQDAAEAYSVALLQQLAEDAGRAQRAVSANKWADFENYLAKVNVTRDEFVTGAYAAYKVNADRHLPTFVDRLSARFPNEAFEFTDVERDARNRGLKADFLIALSSGAEIPVSLKNYIGSAGIARPQVQSGTFNSFVLSFFFERQGAPGCFVNPGTMAQFRGSDKAARDAALVAIGQAEVVALMGELDALQAKVRQVLLGPDFEFYDKTRVAELAYEVGHRGVVLSLDIFTRLGADRMREVMVKRIGFDGEEESLYFDSTLYTDSITNRRYHDLVAAVVDPHTEFAMEARGKGIKFAFRVGDRMVLDIDVPYTINTNGAWHRPKKYFEGMIDFRDKRKIVQLRHGQRRPYKSREISTSVNTYPNLAATGIFEAAASGRVDKFDLEA